MPVPKGAGLGKADNSYFCVGHPEKRSLNGGKKDENEKEFDVVDYYGVADGISFSICVHEHRLH